MSGDLPGGVVGGSVGVGPEVVERDGSGTERGLLSPRRLVPDPFVKKLEVDVCDYGDFD